MYVDMYKVANHLLRYDQVHILGRGSQKDLS